MSIPFDFKKLNKKINKHNENSFVGGKAKKKKTQKNTEETPLYVVTKDETSMTQNFKSGIAWGAGRVLIEGVANLFSG